MSVKQYLKKQVVYEFREANLRAGGKVGQNCIDEGKHLEGLGWSMVEGLDGQGEKAFKVGKTV